MSEWYSFNDQMKQIFGGKVYRLSLSTGCTCPNRDGTLSSSGCIFCSAGGSGEFAVPVTMSNELSQSNLLSDIEREAADKKEHFVSELSLHSAFLQQQIDFAKQKVQGKIGKNTPFAGYMAYFQSFTSTYGDTNALAKLFEETAALPEIVALSIATRPDCLGTEMIDRLAAINRRKPVFVELGLQTIHEDTAAYINRCYTLDVFEDAFRRLKAAGIRVVVHVMIGLPGEDASRTKETVSYLAKLCFLEEDSGSGAGRSSHIDGIKFSLLHVLRGTRLEKLLPVIIEYRTSADNVTPQKYIELKDGKSLPQYSLEEYAVLIKELAALLPEETAIHRVTGDPPKRYLILPEWVTDKKRVLNTIRAEFRK